MLECECWGKFYKLLVLIPYVQDAANFSATLTTRLKEIDAVADEMVAKVESMKKEMITRKEVNIIAKYSRATDNCNFSTLFPKVDSRFLGFDSNHVILTDFAAILANKGRLLLLVYEFFRIVIRQKPVRKGF